MLKETAALKNLFTVYAFDEKVCGTFVDSARNFEKQLMEGFETSPYYLDIILRRILLRVFAEEWF